jgi:branched-chain amino acid transport system permease protein
MIFALLGVFWNLSSGIGGQFSFGHAAYFGIGAYTTAFCVVDLGLSPWVGMAAGAILAGAAGALIGWLTFRYRLRDAYFALATFAFAELLRLIVVRFEPLRAGVGYRLPLAPDSGWLVLQFSPGDVEYLILASIMLVGALALTIGILQGRFGYRLVAVREDEQAAAAIGIDPTAYKIGALTTSAIGTSLVGTLYLSYHLFIDPDIAFGPSISIQAIMAAIIGGVGTIWGPVVGAALLVLVSEVATSLTRSPPEFLSMLAGRSGLDLIIYGIVLTAILLMVPRGIYGSAVMRWGK